jgi:AcrR family transcriptional regulator
MANVGRPRSFDKDEALKKAMHLFWEKGYEGTSMADLVDAIGMKAPSIYAAFGNKDAMFQQAVAMYFPIVANGQLAVLNNTPDIVEAVESTLNECVKLFTGDKNPHTCLIMTAAINASPENIGHVDYLKSLRKDYKNVWKNRFTLAQKQGQLASSTSPKQLAEYFVAVIQGMAMSAKDGASRNDLSAVAGLAIAVLKK